jgi:hypothetical protein
MRVHLGKGKHCYTGFSHRTYQESRRMRSQIVYGEFFSSPALFSNPIKKRRNIHGTVRPSRKGMPEDLGHKEMKLKQDDIKV